LTGWAGESGPRALLETGGILIHAARVLAGHPDHACHPERCSRQDSIALIVTEVGSRNVYASNELRGELCRRIRELLERGLRCEYDALLPRIGAQTAADLFFHSCRRG